MTDEKLPTELISFKENGVVNQIEFRICNTYHNPRPVFPRLLLFSGWLASPNLHTNLKTPFALTYTEVGLFVFVLFFSIHFALVCTGFCEQLFLCLPCR